MKNIILFLIISISLSDILFAGTYSGGNGTLATPYQIANVADLSELSTTTADWGSYFIQTADIDASSITNFSPIGNNSNPFYGTYDGKNFKISNLTITRSTTDYVGLFGKISNPAVIKDLGLTLLNITGQDYVGGLIGFCNLSNVSNCFATGIILGKISTGGIIGESSGSTIQNCYSEANVSGDNLVGGFIGYPVNGCILRNCYSLGDVTRISSSTTTDFAGFCGSNSESTIEYCYSTGSVTYAGGTNPTTSGFVASEFGTTTYTANFFDETTSGQTSAGVAGSATAKTTAAMKTQSTFTGWDFSTIWQIIGTNYPDLRNNSNSALPVELTSFSAVILNENTVNLNWQTATEVNNYGFEIQRAINNEQLKNINWKKINFIAGAGNSNTSHNYSFTDKPTGGTSYSYRLKQIDVDGKFEYSNILTVTVNMPNSPELMQNSPNPFNPSTTIKYYIPQTEDVKITIFDMLGREVNTLINEQTSAGYHIAFWNGRENNGSAAASGVYLYRLQAGSFIETKKMSLLK